MPSSEAVDLVVLHEHPEWQKPLFAALERRGVGYAACNLTRAAFNNVDAPIARHPTRCRYHRPARCVLCPAKEPSR